MYNKKKIVLLVACIVCIAITSAFVYSVTLYKRNLMEYTDFLMHSNFLAMIITFTVLISAVLVMSKSNTERYQEEFCNPPEKDSKKK